MSKKDHDHPDDLHHDHLEEVEEVEEIIEDSRDDRRSSGISGWIISTSVHGLVMLIFAYAVWATVAEETELPPMRVTSIDPPPKPEDKNNLDRQVENTVEINVTSETDVAAPISQLDVPLEENNTSEDENEAEIAKGREEAVASSETGSTGAFMAIGAGGGSAGQFGSRSGGGKSRALAKGGGTRASESAVDAALRWFLRHQSPDGSWDVISYPNNCTEDGAKCEPGHYLRTETSHAGITGLVALCFLGAGYDHLTPNKYRKTIARAIDWIIASQQADGSFMAGAYNYEQAICTMTMAETFAMTNDPRCRDAAVKGWSLFTGRRYEAKYQGEVVCGWGDYKGPDHQFIRASATAWGIQAMKSLLAGGLDIGDAPAGLKNYLTHMWEGTVKLDGKDPRQLDPYNDISSLAYRFYPEGEGAGQYNKDRNVHNLPGVGLLSAVFLGLKDNEVMERTLANYIIKKQLPTKWPTNLYYVYYNTFALFQMGGEYWSTYNPAMRDLLVAKQRTEPPCFNGSWNNGNFFGNEHGRVLDTVLACLSLEVYYRYAQVHGHAEDKKKTEKKSK